MFLIDSSIFNCKTAAYIYCIQFENHTWKTIDRPFLELIACFKDTTLLGLFVNINNYSSFTNKMLLFYKITNTDLFKEWSSNNLRIPKTVYIRLHWNLPVGH